MADDQKPNEAHTCPGCGQTHDLSEFDPTELHLMASLAGWLGHQCTPQFHPEKGAMTLVPVTHPIFQFIVNVASMAHEGEDIINPDFDMSTLKEGEEPPLIPATRTPEEIKDALDTLISNARELLSEGQQFLMLMSAKPEQGGQA